MKGLICTAALLAASPALANDKQDFPDCDGRIHPGKQDDGMRGEASASRFSQLQSAFGGLQAPVLLERQAQARVDACTRALESPRLLPGQGLRRAHLLRARAAARIEGGKLVEALGDLDQADAAVADRRSEPFFERSMGASLKLMRTIILLETGDPAQARALAEQAMTARPYALSLQRTGAVLMEDLVSAGEPALQRWNQVVRLDPNSANMAITAAADAGRFAEVVRLNSVLSAPNATAVTPGSPVPSLTTIDVMAMTMRPRIAYAMAATGNLAGARAELDRFKASLGISGTDTAPHDPMLVNVDRILGGLAARTIRQVEARIALAEGRRADAVALFDQQPPLPRDAIGLDLLAQLKATLPAADAAKIDDRPLHEAMLRARSQTLRRLAGDLLLAPETPRAVVDYSKSRPNILGALVGGAFSLGTSLLGGIERTDGFRSSSLPDGRVKVEFTGNTPSEALVQEMTLLRAAELARTAGKWGFVITGRADYTRYLVTTQYSVETNRTPTGHKTELVIRFVDEGIEPDRALGAVALIDALGPYYYEDKTKK